MNQLLEYLIYPAQVSIEFCPELTYNIRLQTQKDELFTSGVSFENTCKMASSILIDMSYALAIEETIPPCTAFTQHFNLLKNLKTWLSPVSLSHVPDKAGNLNFNELYLKAGYLSQLINLIALADHFSPEQKTQTLAQLDLLLQQPLTEVFSYATKTAPHSQGKAKTKFLNKGNKPEQLAYLLHAIAIYATAQQDTLLLDTCTALLELSSKLPNLFINSHKLKKRTPLQEELAILIPLDSALKFMLCNAILEHKVKLRDLAEDLQLSKDDLLDKLDFYSATPIAELNAIFNRLGLTPDCSLE